MANEPQVLTTTNGERVSLSPFDIKAIRDLGNGVEVDTHAGETFQFPIPNYIFSRMMTIDMRGTGNSVRVVDPIKPR